MALQPFVENEAAFLVLLERAFMKELGGENLIEKLWGCNNESPDFDINTDL